MNIPGRTIICAIIGRNNKIMAGLILYVILILVLDGIVSASESAIYSVPMHRVEALAKKYKTGEILRGLKISMEKPIAALNTLSTFITIVGSIFAGIIAGREFGNLGVGIFAAAQTVLVMVVGEMAPKRLGERYADRVALIVAPAVDLFSRVLRPLTWLVDKITSPFMTKATRTVSQEDIEFLADIATKEGAIGSGEGQLIKSVFRLNGITAGDIMTTKPMVDFIDGTKTIGEMRQAIENAKHSRLPVFEGDQNNIIGIVHQRNLLIALAKGEFTRLIKDYAWDIMVVPDSRPIDDLLKDMRDKRSQLALVVSDYGNVVGVVGIEDIIEELVGEIIDEKDVAPEFIKRISKNEIVAHGQTRISYINHFFNTEIKSKKNLNGFLLEKFGELPSEGEFIEHNGIKFIAESVGPRTIDRVHIIKKSLSEELKI